jgi:hypothetical protein
MLAASRGSFEPACLDTATRYMRHQKPSSRKPAHTPTPHTPLHQRRTHARPQTPHPRPPRAVNVIPRHWAYLLWVVRGSQRCRRRNPANHTEADHAHAPPRTGTYGQTATRIRTPVGPPRCPLRGTHWSRATEIAPPSACALAAASRAPTQAIRQSLAPPPAATTSSMAPPSCPQKHDVPHQKTLCPASRYAHCCGELPHWRCYSTRLDVHTNGFASHRRAPVDAERPPSNEAAEHTHRLQYSCRTAYHAPAAFLAANRAEQWQSPAKGKKIAAENTTAHPAIKPPTRMHHHTRTQSDCGAPADADRSPLDSRVERTHIVARSP